MIVVRFAPSPSGYLHLGSTRTALYNWLFARQNGGKFILRIEDTDEYANRPEAIDAIKDALQWLGLDWDEFFRQSARNNIYSCYIEGLESLDLVYPCFCSKEDLMRKRVAMRRRGIAPTYDNTCRQLSLSEREANLKEGKTYVLRFATPEDGHTRFEDLIRRKKQRGKEGGILQKGGQFGFESGRIGDFVIMRPNSRAQQVATFLFAGTIDDHKMGVTHVIRAEEHIHNTPRQIMLQQALGFKTPVYAHLPPVLGAGGKKLSSSRGATNILEYRRQGYLPEAILNLMMLLGWGSAGRTKRILKLDDMLDYFNLEDVSTRRGKIDLRQLMSLNSKHIGELSDEELAKRIGEYAATNESRFSRTADMDYIKVASVCKDRVRTLADLDFLFQIHPIYKEEARRILQGESSLSILKMVLNHTKILQDFSPGSIEEVIRKLADENSVSLRDLTGTVRAAITGSKVSPNLFGIMSLLGKEEVLKRLSNAPTR